MNKTLIVLMLFIYGSMSGKVPLSKLSNNSVESVVISEAQLFFETISPEGEFNKNTAKRVDLTTQSGYIHISTLKHLANQ